MSDYLDRLEAELLRAGYAEPRRVWPARVAAGLAVAAVAAVFLVAVVGGAPPVERAAEPAPGEVRATFDGLMTDDDGLRVGVTLGEPATVEVEVRGDGGLIASRTERDAVGQTYLDLPVPGASTRQLGVAMRVTDADGNVETFGSSIAPAATPGTAAFSVFSDASSRVDAAPGLPASALGPGAEVHRVRVLGPTPDGLWAALGDVACVSAGLPEGPAVGCWELGARLFSGRAKPIISDTRLSVLLALVPDGTQDIVLEFEGGRSRSVEPLGNVVFSHLAGAPTGVSWTAPDGERVAFDL